MNDEIIEEFEKSRGKGNEKFADHESPAKVFKEYLIDRIEFALLRFRQRRLKKM